MLTYIALGFPTITQPVVQRIYSLYLDIVDMRSALGIP